MRKNKKSVIGKLWGSLDRLCAENPNAPEVQTIINAEEALMKLYVQELRDCEKRPC